MRCRTPDVEHTSLEPWAVVDPLGRRTSFTYDGAGNRTSVRDPLGRITTYIYNARSLVSAQVDPAGNRTTYQFDDNGNRTGTVNCLAIGHG